MPDDMSFGISIFKLLISLKTLLPFGSLNKFIDRLGLLRCMYYIHVIPWYNA